jgi:capsular polysaccharide export protein
MTDTISSFLLSPVDVWLWRDSYLRGYLDAPLLPDLPYWRKVGACHLGWGKTKSGLQAMRRAQNGGRCFLLLEDGFLRSLGLARKKKPLLSLVMDDLGMYYDAYNPSRLEQLIAEGASPALLDDARRAMTMILQHKLSKYNYMSEVLPPLPENTERVLVVDQAADNPSVRFGGVNADSFASMLAAALAENPTATVLVKAHPAVLAGLSRSCFNRDLNNDSRVVRIEQDVNPLALLAAVDKVYVATSHVGFEALLLGKPVVCFGMPWYAGWGLTDDRHADIEQLRERRFISRSVEQLFAAAYLRYTHYRHPETNGHGTIFDVIGHLAEAKRLNDESRGTLYYVDNSLWRRAVIPTFLKTPSNRLRFIAAVDDLEGAKLPADARLVAWGRSKDSHFSEFAEQHGLPVLRMEDGFLRSVGLGSDSRRPLSLVVDGLGIYFDPRQPSALELWLETGQPDAAELARAAFLREHLVNLGLSKYNLGKPFILAEAAAGRRVILVPGQVEDDASVLFGSPVICTNLALLEAVRTANPDAFLIYKPHPDVVAASRLGKVDITQLEQLCDQITIDADIIDCIRLADEVHTMTSQAGFEALLHGKIVHCYGLPFYAGWGLTQDKLFIKRRTRRLSLDELVYGALIHYPRYVDPYTLKHISAEWAVGLLEQARQNSEGKLIRSGRLVRDLRKVWEWIRVVLFHD